MSMRTDRRGLMLVLSSPSGAGKTTLSRGLLAEEAGIAMSISVTTRQPRPGEVDGKDYHFRTVAEFEHMRDAGELLEWARVHDNYYGTPTAPVMAALARGEDVLFDIDWQGAQQLTAKARGDLVRVFVLPPSADALAARLRGRAQDGEAVVARRLAAAGVEISHWAEYDYAIVNVDVAESLATLRAILSAERNRVTRQTGLADLARTLQADLDAKRS